MTETTGVKEWELKALTGIWTGSAEGYNPRPITTGLLGSIRWWFEVLVRGMRGSACDPTNTKCEGSEHCVVCELFGCTGWARKFRFDVVGKDSFPIKDGLKKNDMFTLRFTPLRPIQDEEWALIDATLRLIAEYGAIGGKTVFKPSDEEGRKDKKHHRDYGLVEISGVDPSIITARSELEDYVREGQWKRQNSGDYGWASLEHFWFVGGKVLSRKSSEKSIYNKILGREERKKSAGRNSEDELSRWLSGSQGKSKKVFSFKEREGTFGFVKPSLIDFQLMEKRLQGVWGEGGWYFMKGKEVIDKLLDKRGERQ